MSELAHDPLCRLPRGWWKCQCEEYALVRADQDAKSRADERERIRAWCMEGKHYDGCACDVIDALTRIASAVGGK